MEKTTTTRKKTCARCGLRKWRSKDFYTPADSYCKECAKEYKRERYAATRKAPEGVRKDPRTGLLWEHHGHSKRIHWSPPMVEKMRRLFPWATNEDLAVELGVSQRTVIRKARELGLSKHPDFMRKKSLKGCEMMRFINKYIGNKGQFAKGCTPWNKKTKPEKQEIS